MCNDAAFSQACLIQYVINDELAMVTAAGIEAEAFKSVQRFEMRCLGGGSGKTWRSLC